MKVYAFVPAKGTSERIENKNMRFLDGDRLYIKALKTLLACKEIDRVFLDTESEQMYELVDYLPVTFMKRDSKLANNNTDGHQMFLNEINSYPEADIYVQLLCTSPFINPQTIDNAIKILKTNMEYDSAVLMKKEKFYFWNNDNTPMYDINHIPNSKDLPETLIESMGLYISRKDTALTLKRRYGNKPYLIFGELEELIDVNNQADLDFAQIYAKGKKQKENEKLRMIKHFISAPALSDLLDDMFIEKGEICGAVFNDWRCNIKNSKIFGRANTLRLRALKDDEDFNGIYDALESYKQISENDIIVVENELRDFAYFGDLNARLAIRSGACGAVVDGATRDIQRVAALNFPVYYKTSAAADVRRRATLDYINKPIKIDNKCINPGDLIFIDDCAMVVLYQKYEAEIIERVLKTLKNEQAIINDIWQNIGTNEIISKRGNF